jgi:catechol 2,3-dioxygenase-like lactoylglutathione lyase family enzyme
MHFGVTVDDVPAALARVEAAGGRRRFNPKTLDGTDRAQFVYCEDPDGHVFELLSLPHPEVVAIINARDAAA